MRGKSIYWAIFSFIFSIVGFFVNLLAIGTGKDIINICIIAMIYITPLLIDVVEEVANLDVYTYKQYELNRVALIIGTIHFLSIMLVFALYSSISTYPYQSIIEAFIKTLFSLMPLSFVARSLYAFLIKWNQIDNTANAYFSGKKIEYSK